jgi:hypothetical protein
LAVYEGNYQIKETQRFVCCFYISATVSDEKAILTVSRALGGKAGAETKLGCGNQTVASSRILRPLGQSGGKR